MNATYGSSRSFRSRLRSEYIGYNTYAGRRSHSCSNPTPIHGPVKKYDLNHSYLRSYLSWLPKSVAKTLLYCLSHKFSYDSKIIDPVNNGFIPNEVTSHLRTCDQYIVTFGIGGLCLGFSNTSRVDSLDLYHY